MTVPLPSDIAQLIERAGNFEQRPSGFSDYQKSDIIRELTVALRAFVEREAILTRMNVRLFDEADAARQRLTEAEQRFDELAEMCKNSRSFLSVVKRLEADREHKSGEAK